jgi:glycosyltransferase involved in cell wall biosynthesis
LKRKILWLASWYPNKLEPFNGDFIERHAKAASLLNDITVIHVVRDHKHLISGKTTIVKRLYENYPSLTTLTCYYKSVAGSFSLLKYFRLQQQLIKKYIGENGKPDVINVHISFKAGLGALYAKWRYGISYVVSEQWTIFCPESRPSFQDQSSVARMCIAKIYKGASRSSAVSYYLAQSLAKMFGIEKPVRIANVVDTSLFYPSARRHDVFTFIHISVLNYQKSPDEIIDAVDFLRKKTDKPFRFIMYGPFISLLEEKIKKQNLDDVIEYRQEVIQSELAAEVRQCHSLVLYSRFETFGCVVIEALASGLPVVVSDIPVMHELVTENENGVFTNIEDTEDLAQKMLWMMENYESFDPKKISDEAKKKYSFLKISEQFDKLYKAEV